MMLTVENLHKSYQVGQTTYEVLKGISLEVEKGEFVALRGLGKPRCSTASPAISRLIAGRSS